MMKNNLILASASPARLSLLQAVGVLCTVRPSEIDETLLKKSFQEQPVSKSAEMLAEAKAQDVSHLSGDALVIGADQMLECEGRLFDKPRDRAQASAQLQALRGKPHRLVSAVVVVRNGQKVWAGVDEAILTMRPFSDAFLESYLDHEGSALFSSVGAYRIEGWGAQLFTSIRGDYFTILGLPLLPLLEFLRSQGVLST